jgi:hypothetical protein
VDAPPLQAAPAPPTPRIAPPGEFDREAEAVPAAYVPTPYEAKPVGFTTAPPPIRPLQWDQPRVQRVRSSQVTFGIFGRVVVTLLILAFLAWLLVYSTPFIIPALPMSVWALKDNWRRAPERRAPEPTQVADGPRVVARDPFAPLAADVVFDPHVRLPEPGATPSA